ncbi:MULTISPECIES: hypothetical protein [Geobacter]|uniref:Uncharacterized protein n=2 Tax=Geobacter TaxID=28231 RepID=A0A0C1QQA0_9BACT|nr:MULTISPECIES: hypothetical protein [Geobacter]KIE42877.1 hypothetical protein SE37_09645 [Geobacter soli]MBE2889408.1 hypothetical protein [Geobacter anodireducens]HMN03951.1 hypothetical protein [Geobacter anodireducens]
MTMGKKIQEMAVWIEFLVGSGLAIFFHLVLHYEQAAYVIFGIGILLALGTYLIREDIEKNRAHLVEQYHQSHEIPFALASITDPECLAKAHELIAGAKRSITLLQQGYIPLDENEFYLEGARLSDQAVREIRAVDPLTAGYWTRGALVNFYQANLRALDRGVRIRRIFVLNREELAEPEIQKVLLGQYRDDIDIRIVYRDELPATGDAIGRDTNSSFDFALYDDRVATDVFAHPGKYYGRKTGHPVEVAKYRHLYDLIEHSAHAVCEEGDRIAPSAGAMPLAS